MAPFWQTARDPWAAAGPYLLCKRQKEVNLKHSPLAEAPEASRGQQQDHHLQRSEEPLGDTEIGPKDAGLLGYRFLRRCRQGNDPVYQDPLQRYERPIGEHKSALVPPQDVHDDTSHSVDGIPLEKG